MARIAIIGGGISGLAAAHLLHRRHDIVLFEKAHRVGGHTRTLEIRYGDREIAVDTGFIVFNRRNYPLLTRLFADLGVATQESDMSFGVTIGGGRLEWGARNLNAMFGQRRNLLRPSFYRLMRDVFHFNAHALNAVTEMPDLTLGELLAQMGLGRGFRLHYLLPMGGAIWSCPPRQMLEFPAASFVRFFHNHGLLSVSGQPQWYTVTGGAQNYVARMTRPFAHRVRTACAIVSVTREANGIRVADSHGRTECFEHVVFASHGDETLTMLRDATAEERAVLGAFRYQRNRAILHRDVSVMPRRRRCWASWVYQSDGSGEEASLAVSYWMNRLQSLDPDCPLFVTLNPAREIPHEFVFDEHEFHHPVFDAGAVAAQKRLPAMQGRQGIWYCGAHLGNGFHEDGLASAVAVAQALDETARMPVAHAFGPGGPSPLRAADEALRQSVG